MAKDQEFPEILSKQESVNIQKAEPGAPPSDPKPAATVLLVRAPENEIEVFMIKRNAKTNFGGAWVFPGGKLDPVDEEIEINSFCSGLTDEMASQIINVESGGLNYWIACIRECFEECGVLLAYRENGNLFGASDTEETKILASYRDRLNNGEPVLLELCKELNLKLAVDRLAYVSHWITPKMEMKRYSTRFFIALAPSDQKAIHDGSEGVESTWITPENAIKGGEKGNFPIILPTIRNLEAIVGFTSTNELLENKIKCQSEVSSIEPKFFMKDRKMIGLSPGDEGYEDH